MARKVKTTERKLGEKVAIDCYTTINPGEIRFGRSTEETHFNKKKNLSRTSY